MPDLAERQYELGGVVFGDLTPVQCDDVDIGDVGRRTGDRESPGSDGVQFGLDYHDGRLLTWELWTDTTTATDARSAWATLRTAWSGDQVRGVSRAVMPLRMHLPGSDTVRVYGRPRRMTPASQRSRADGVIDLVADFQTADRAFYADVEQERTLTLLPNLSGGLMVPFTPPVVLNPVSNSDSTMATNTGDLPTWPVITFHGPITNPSVEWVATGARLTLQVTLATGRSVTVDTRPWARTALRDDGASLAGQLRGPRLSEFTLPVGSTQIAFRGQDPTGTSSCRVSWRDAYSTP
jgi:hypothetical protein